MSDHKPKLKVQQLTGWGYYPKVECKLERPERIKDLRFPKGKQIARGLGRSYGDAALNSRGTVVLLERLDRMLEFDEKSGILRAEAGLTLDDIIKVFLPRGWFLPVTPGTRYVTLGGCLAADVHGKNHHHHGCFSRFVKEIELLTPSRGKVKASPDIEKELFWATAGGMGLTGVITEMTLQLMPVETAYVKVSRYSGKDLSEVLGILQDRTLDDIYSVAWIDALAVGDSLGRGVVMNGHHALLEDLPQKLQSAPLKLAEKKVHNLPFFLPGFCLNKLTVKAFNTLYYRFESVKKEASIVDFDAYFYPLDFIHNWNRLYGKKGFLQYQFVIPFRGAEECLRQVLKHLQKSCSPSFLAVLKRFGKEGAGHLSFPFEGFTLALDLPMQGASTLEALRKADEIVLRFGGRLYLAKDARMSAEMFHKTYPRFQEWSKVKKQIDPLGSLSSDLSERLKMEGGK